MGGITNYFHGESGRVVSRQTVPSHGVNAQALRLAGDPHRELAYDYGGDIGIDPVLQQGDRAVFVRLDPYTGVWTSEGHHFYPEVQEAVDRVSDRRRRTMPPGV